MQITWCVMQLPTTAVVVAIFLLYFVGHTFGRQRHSNDAYVAKWGVDRAAAGSVATPKRYWLSRMLLWMAILPLYLLFSALIGVAVGVGIPMFYTCPLISFYEGIGSLMALFVCALPATVLFLGVAMLLTPRAQAYGHRLAEIRREDLPESPEQADLETLLSQIPAGRNKTRPLAIAMVAIGIAGLVGLFAADIPDTVYTRVAHPELPDGQTLSWLDQLALMLRRLMPFG